MLAEKEEQGRRCGALLARAHPGAHVLFPVTYRNLCTRNYRPELYTVDQNHININARLVSGDCLRSPGRFTNPCKDLVSPAPCTHPTRSAPQPPFGDC